MSLAIHVLHCCDCAVRGVVEQPLLPFAILRCGIRAKTCHEPENRIWYKLEMNINFCQKENEQTCSNQQAQPRNHKPIECEEETVEKVKPGSLSVVKAGIGGSLIIFTAKSANQVKERRQSRKSFW